MTTQKSFIENNPRVGSKTMLYLPGANIRQGEGGLRTQGHFKQTHGDTPLITIVTVVYNGSQYLEETIQSVITQSYKNLEYIIIDGGSTDTTLKIIRKYAHAIDYWVSEKDNGIYDAMNKGIILASGDWINFMNAGDVFASDNVIKAIFNFNRYKKISVVYGSTEMVKNYFSHVVLPKKIELLISGRMPFVHQSVFIKSKIMKEYLYSQDYNVNSDFNFFLCIFLLNHNFKRVDFVISKYRLGGYSHQNMMLNYSEKLKILRNNNLSLWRFKLYYFFIKIRSKLKIICPIFIFLGLHKVKILNFITKRCVN